MAISLHPVKAAFGILLAVGAIYGAYRSWDDARFAHLRTSNPPRAIVVRADDAFSLGKVIDDRTQARPDVPISQADLERARLALIKAPLSRALLRIVGLNAVGDGDTSRADAALDMSDRVSRRDGLTQLALIERSVAKDDMNAAVRHYHAALSVHPELKPALLPILTRALSFPQVRSALAPYFARQAPWAADLMEDAITNGNPTDIAKLVIPVGDMVRGDRYDDLTARLISKLAERGDFVLAREVAVAVVPKANVHSLASVAVSDATTDARLGGLAWKLSDADRILATPNGLGGFDIDLEPLVRGQVASRLVPVSGGREYVFGQTLRGASEGGATSLALNWQAFCLSAAPKALVWQQMLPVSRRTQRYESAIVVPPACTGLEFVLNARGPEGQQPGHAAIESLELRQRSR